MTRTAWVLALLLVASLAWAYRLAHPPPGASGDGRGVVVWRVPTQEVARVTYRTGGRTVSLEPLVTKGEGAPVVVVRLEESRAEAPLPDWAGRGFRGDVGVVRTLPRLTTLQAERDLGMLDGLDGATFGLPDTDDALVLTARDGTTRRLLLGRTVHQGARRYAMQSDTQRVFVLRNALLRGLQGAPQHLLDTAVLPRRPQQAARVTVQRGDTAVTLWPVPDADNTWARSPGAAAGEPDAGALIVALARLRATAYRAPPSPEGEDEAGTGVVGSTPPLAVRLYDQAEGGSPQAWLHLWLRDDGEAVAHSSYTRAPVTVPQAPAADLLRAARAMLATP